MITLICHIQARDGHATRLSSVLHPARLWLEIWQIILAESCTRAVD